MTESINCVFLRPTFHVYDFHNIVFYCDPEPDTPPSLRLTVGSVDYAFPPPSYEDGRLVWPLDTVGDFQDIAPEEMALILTPNEEPPRPYKFDELVFLGPVRGSGPHSNIFLLECVSGLYARPDDVRGQSIQFEADSLPTLDYRNILIVRQHLFDFARSHAQLEERRQKLREAGIDLERLAEMKAEYEESMKRRRRAQFEFMKTNQKMQAATIHQHSERDFESAKEALKQHIQANQQKAQKSETTRVSHERLLNFRVAGLDELKVIFPFTFEKGQLCGVQHFVNPTSGQWSEMRAFLGFATHYIREVSRIVGIPVPYLLVPQAGSSRVVARLTDTKTQLTPEYSPQTLKVVQTYEAALVTCCKHIAETLQVGEGTSGPSPLLGYLKVLNSITRDNLQVLMPASAHQGPPSTGRPAPA
jgi:hypothetical protein